MHKHNFSKISTMSGLFKAKQLAFGKVKAMRGRPMKVTTGSKKKRKRTQSKSDDSEDEESTITDENNLGLKMDFDEEQDLSCSEHT